ncbi:phosphatase PAP2 family protein [Candidatus Micrarchaeota archaeon]|nr:phosphatase PAP2 family protein [Candidatus Micrarchaeota archaeon]
MDTITSIAMSVDCPGINEIGMILQNPAVYLAVIIALLLIGERRNEKRVKVLFSLILTFLLVTGIKYVMAKERPCVEGEWCPDGYSFPSTHAAIAFTLMTAFLNKKSYPAYLLFALFVAFTRLNLGVHTFYDVAGALPVAMISYYITDVVWGRIK